VQQKSSPQNYLFCGEREGACLRLKQAIHVIGPCFPIGQTGAGDGSNKTVKKIHYASSTIIILSVSALANKDGIFSH
jgi:hypothetical protein